jgi:hypothetical protein
MMTDPNDLLNAKLDREAAQASLDATGFTASLAARKAYEEQGARRGGFLNAAQRGFIGGGMAATAAEPGLAQVGYDATARESDALNTEIARIMDQRRFNQTMNAQQESDRLQREANRPHGLFGFLFG